MTNKLDRRQHEILFRGWQKRASIDPLVSKDICPRRRAIGGGGGERKEASKATQMLRNSQHLRSTSVDVIVEERNQTRRKRSGFCDSPSNKDAEETRPWFSPHVLCECERPNGDDDNNDVMTGQLITLHPSVDKVCDLF